MFYINKNLEATLEYGNTGAKTIFIKDKSESLKPGDVVLMKIVSGNKTIFRRIIDIENLTDQDGIEKLGFNITFTHEESRTIPVGKYNWDVTIYADPVIENGILVNGRIVETPKEVRWKEFRVKNIASKEDMA